MDTLGEARIVTLFEIKGGAALWSVARDLCRWAKENNAEAVAVFNGRALTVTPDTFEREVLMQFDAGMTKLFAGAA